MRLALEEERGFGSKDRSLPLCKLLLLLLNKGSDELLDTG
jgi:hypothetical protein